MITGILNLGERLVCEFLKVAITATGVGRRWYQHWESVMCAITCEVHKAGKNANAHGTHRNDRRVLATSRKTSPEQRKRLHDRFDGAQTTETSSASSPVPPSLSLSCLPPCRQRNASQTP